MGRIFGALAILGQKRVDDRILDHHAEVERTHVRHAAVAVARIDIGAEQAILLVSRHGWHAARNKARITLKHALHRTVGRKFVCQHAHRDAGLASFTIRHVGDVLAAPETCRKQTVDEFERLVVREMREELALQPSRQIRTRLRRSNVELGKPLLLFRHPVAPLRALLALIAIIVAAKPCDQVTRRQE